MPDYLMEDSLKDVGSSAFFIVSCSCEGRYTVVDLIVKTLYVIAPWLPLTFSLLLFFSSTLCPSKCSKRNLSQSWSVCAEHPEFFTEMARIPELTNGLWHILQVFLSRAVLRMLYASFQSPHFTSKLLIQKQCCFRSLTMGLNQQLIWKIAHS